MSMSADVVFLVNNYWLTFKTFDEYIVQICRKYRTKYIVKLPKKNRPTLLMVENKLWNSSCLISRRLRYIVTLFVEMVSHKIIFFVSASVKCKTSEKSVGKVEPNTKLCFATSYLLVFFKSSRRHNKNPSV